MLSLVELQRFERGAEVKRVVRAAAALREMYDDTAIAAAVGMTRIAVGKWWQGARPEPDALARLADATGLSFEELATFVYRDGPPPAIVQPGSPADMATAEAVRLDLERQQHADLTGLPASPPRPPRGRPEGLS